MKNIYMFIIISKSWGDEVEFYSKKWWQQDVMNYYESYVAYGLKRSMYLYRQSKEQLQKAVSRDWKRNLVIISLWKKIRQFSFEVQLSKDLQIQQIIVEIIWVRTSRSAHWCFTAIRRMKKIHMLCFQTTNFERGIRVAFLLTFHSTRDDVAFFLIDCPWLNPPFFIYGRQGGLNNREGGFYVCCNKRISKRGDTEGFNVLGSKWTQIATYVPKR